MVLQAGHRLAIVPEKAINVLDRNGLYRFTLESHRPPTLKSCCACCVCSYLLAPLVQRAQLPTAAAHVRITISTLAPLRRTRAVRPRQHVGALAVLCARLAVQSLRHACGHVAGERAAGRAAALASVSVVGVVANAAGVRHRRTLAVVAARPVDGEHRRWQESGGDEERCSGCAFVE